jgi:hypothetical protein
MSDVLLPAAVAAGYERPPATGEGSQDSRPPRGGRLSKEEVQREVAVHDLRGSVGGAKGARTPDLLNAIQTLFQLSYSPTREGEYIAGSRPPGLPWIQSGVASMLTIAVVSESLSPSASVTVKVTLNGPLNSDDAE